MRLVPGEDFGRYRIEAELGRGGQAVVYRATQVDLERQVALKVFDEGYLARPGALERFRREAIASGRLTHPHIVTVYDAGEIDGVAYIAMRLVGGDTLGARLRRAGALPPAEALGVLDDIAGALDSAHAAGTVHRDVTPGNILLDPDDGAYLSDFGLVRMDDMPGLTRRGDWLGTAEYVSPEQVEGDQAQPASDRYALAAVAFEALTGRPPYVHREPSAVLLAHVRDAVPRASEINPALPPSVDAVLERALSKAPGERPGSAAALVAELRGALPAQEEAREPAADGGDPWAAALARFAGGAGAGAAAHAAGTPADGGGRPVVEERPTEAFGGRIPGRKLTVARELAVAAALAGALLVGAALAGGWLLGSSNADTSGAQERGYSEGQAAGRDAGFAAGRRQGVKEGRAAGRKTGLAEGRKQGRADGLEEGREAGYSEGRDAGYASGVAEGRSTALGALSPGNWYVVWIGSDANGAQIGNSTAMSPDSGVCYTINGGTVYSGACGGGDGD